MKVKTSVTLSQDLLCVIDTMEGPGRRSSFLEEAARYLIEKKRLDEQNARDLDILNKHADRLNAEAIDVLEYQAIP